MIAVSAESNESSDESESEGAKRDVNGESAGSARAMHGWTQVHG